MISSIARRVSLSRSPRSIVALLALAMIGCGGSNVDSSPTTPIPKGAGMFALVVPESIATVDAAVAKSPAVVVRDASGHGQSGIRVTFRVVAGGGSLADSVVVTDANGRATLGTWTLGPTAIANVVEASAPGQSAVQFTVGAQWPRRLASSALGGCALLADKVFCWGDNSHSELAVNFGPPSTTTPLPALLGPAGTSTIIELAGSYGQHLCAFITGHAGYCWGRNDYGQAGSALLRIAGIPASLLVHRAWVEIRPGRITTCAVDSAGTGYCWGANQRGEIGNSATLPGFTATPSATLVTTTVKLKSIAAGWEHACGLSTDGAAYCWGANLNGQLGIGTIDSSHITPVAVSTNERFASIATGGLSTCGIAVDGRALCWGENSYGQLGDGTNTLRTVPTQVAGGLRFVSIAMGTFFVSDIPPELGTTAPVAGTAAHTCALTATGQPYCWGWNGWGQLGDGTRQDRLVPTAVAGGLTLSGLALGESSTCGMRKTTVWCWGGNNIGQLGDGTNVRRLQPVRVLFP